VGVLVGARHDARVQAKRIRRLWFAVFLNPKAILPMCLTILL
jgi:hypothetical protein